MGYIAFASAKGSPGVTTAVAALAATWPSDRALVVVELDPSGGDLVVRFDLATEPGLVTLAASGRRDLGPEVVLAHTQPLPGTAEGEGPPRRVLTAPISADQATAALTALRGGLARALDGVEADVVVDCGRLDPPSPAFEVASGAELLVMLARPVVSEVHHLSARLATLSSVTSSLLTVGDRPYPVAEVAEAVGTHPLGNLAADPRAAAALSGDLGNAARVLRRSHLLRDAAAVAEALAGWLGPARTLDARPALPPAPAAPPPLSHQPPTPQPPLHEPPLHHPTPQQPPSHQPPPPAGPPVIQVPVPHTGPQPRPPAPVPPGPDAPTVRSVPAGAVHHNGRGREGDEATAKHFRRDEVEEPR
jgi:hypothetical protein